MPVEARWFNEDQLILHFRYIGEFTWAEAHDADQQIRALLASTDHTIDLLYDLSELQSFPLGSREQARIIAEQPPYPNLGLVVLIGEMVLYDLMRATFKSVGGVPITFAYASTVPGALEVIARERRKRRTRHEPG